MTTDSIKELVKRLRAQGRKNYGLYADAADALEAMAGEVDRLKGQNIAWADKYGDTQNAMYVALDERDRLKAALEFIARGTTGSPDAIIARKALGDAS